MVRDEICKGVDSAAVARALAAGGYLEHEEGRHTKYVRLPERGKTRVFVHCGDAGGTVGTTTANSPDPSTCHVACLYPAAVE